MRTVVIFKNFGPYHLARLAALSGEMDLFAIQLEASTSEYPWDPTVATSFRSFTLLRSALGSRAREAEWELRQILDHISPQVVAIPGWYEPLALCALVWCIENSRQTVLMSDSRMEDERRSILKEFVKSRLVKYFNSALVAGTQHSSYLVALGFCEKAIFKGYDVVDNEHFSKKSNDLSCNIDVVDKYFLVCSRLIQRKRVDLVIEAYSCFKNSNLGQEIKLVIVGNGPERCKLERLASESAWGSDIIFLGNRDYNSLSHIYQNAEAFILASDSDQWGLVVNEAMAASLPVVVSTGAGCALDLVREGFNGYTFQRGCVSSLCEGMKKVTERGERVRLGEGSRTIISTWGLDAFVKGMIDAAEYAAGQSVLKPNLIEGFILRKIARRKVP